MMSGILVNTSADLPSAKSCGIISRVILNHLLEYSVYPSQVVFEIYTFEITATFPRWQWIKLFEKDQEG